MARVPAEVLLERVDVGVDRSGRRLDVGVVPRPELRIEIVAVHVGGCAGVAIGGDHDEWGVGRELGRTHDDQ